MPGLSPAACCWLRQLAGVEKKTLEMVNSRAFPWRIRPLCYRRRHGHVTRAGELTRLLHSRSAQYVRRQRAAASALRWFTVQEPCRYTGAFGPCLVFSERSNP